jgi:hypothetical protein
MQSNVCDNIIMTSLGTKANDMQHIHQVCSA